MNNSELKSIAKSIDKHNKRIQNLIDKIKESDHPNAKEIMITLRFDNEFGCIARAEDIISHFLK